MPLFTDGILSTIEDLVAQDSSVLETSAVESIDLTQKLFLAQDEIGVELSALLPRLSGFDQQFASPANPGLGKVVATAPLRLWHTFQTLSIIYRDSYNNQLNDRYKGKRDEFRELAKWAFRKLIESGVGMVWYPVPRAEQPELFEVSGSHRATVYYAVVAWTNRLGEEGAPSLLKSISIADGKTVAVRPWGRPADASGWNVYAGLSPQSLALQNAAPLGTEATWVQVLPEPLTGRPPGTGQAPNYLRALPRILQRG